MYKKYGFYPISTKSYDESLTKSSPSKPKGLRRKIHSLFVLALVINDCDLESGRCLHGR